MTKCVFFVDDNSLHACDSSMVLNAWSKRKHDSAWERFWYHFLDLRVLCATHKFVRRGFWTRITSAVVFLFLVLCRFGFPKSICTESISPNWISFARKEMLNIIFFWVCSGHAIQPLRVSVGGTHCHGVAYAAISGLALQRSMSNAWSRLKPRTFGPMG